MLYLAYGSNLHPLRLRERIPTAVLLGQTIVPGRLLCFHKRSVIDGSAKCNMVKGVGELHAAVYKMPPRQKSVLDEIEGLGVGYRDEILDIEGYGPCHSYVALDTHIDESLKPYSWYQELVVIGCVHLGFPKDYVDRVAAVACMADPNPVRHDKKMRIVRSAREQTASARGSDHPAISG